MPKRSPDLVNTSPAKRRLIVNHRLIEDAFGSRDANALLEFSSQLPLTLPLSTSELLLRKVTLKIKHRNYPQGLTELVAHLFNDINTALHNAPERDAWVRAMRDRGKSLGFFLYNLGCIASAEHNRYGRKTRRFNLLSALGADTVDVLLKELVHASPSCKAIGSAFYGLGALGQADLIKGSLDSQTVNQLLIQLSKLPEQCTQGISNSIHSLGRVVDSGQLRGMIDAQVINSILTQLTHLQDLDSQAIGNSLHGLGRVVESGQLRGMIDAQVINTLLTQLTNLPGLNSQHVSNSLHGLGRVVESGQLQGMIDAQIINTLLIQLTHLKDLDSQAVSNSLHGLGRMVESGHLQGVIDALVISTLLTQISNYPNRTSQAIGNSLHGLGRVVESGQLQGMIDALVISTLLTELSNRPDPCSQAISNSLHGLGRMAKSGQLQGIIDAQIINTLLIQLTHLTDLDPQAISISLHGLGRIVDSGQLQGMIDAQVISTLLIQLSNHPDLDSQAIGNSLHGMGRLVESGQLQGRNDAQVMSRLLNRLTTLPKPNSQAISNSLHGLGRMVESGQLQGMIDAQLISRLLIQLTNHPDLDSQSIGNSLLGLARLIKNGGLTHLIAYDFLSVLIDHFFHLAPIAIAGTQVLQGLTALITQGAAPQRLVSVNQLEALMKLSLEGSYLHPSKAVEHLHALALFGLRSSALDTQFTELLTAIKSVRLERLSPSLKRQLQKDVERLAWYPKWRDALASYAMPAVPAAPVERTQPIAAPLPLQRPSDSRGVVVRQDRSQTVLTRDHFWEQASENAIFKAIAKQDIRELRCLLNLISKSIPMPSRNEKTTHRHTPSSWLSSRTIQSPEALVREFFAKTNARALRHLVNESTSLCFELLLQACSTHGRYQLAQQTILHPIFIYLPLQQLHQWMIKVDSPFQLYRDHHALLAILDALTIRAEAHPEEQNTLLTLQKNLLKRAIDFHQSCSHHRVINRLNEVKQRLEQRRFTLLDMEVDRGIGYETVERPSTHAIPSSVPAPVQEALPLEAVRGVASVPAVIPRINNSYLYTAEDINRLLLLRLGAAYPHVHVLAAALMREDVQNNRVVNVLHSFLGASPATNQAQTVLIPIASGEHWVGVNLRIEQGLVTKALYYNSLQSVGDEPRKHTIEQELRDAGLVAPQFTIVSSPTQIQQPDNTSCGPFLVENLVHDIKQRGWKPPTSPHERQVLMESIRQFHWNGLNTNDPRYFNRFQRQQTQEAIPSVSHQLQVHGVGRNANTVYASRNRDIIPSQINERRHQEEYGAQRPTN
jgi:hypothetical protein